MVHQGEIFISAGSDHNDRTMEELWTSKLGKVFDTAKSKQMVPGVFLIPRFFIQLCRLGIR